MRNNRVYDYMWTVDCDYIYTLIIYRGEPAVSVARELLAQVCAEAQKLFSTCCCRRIQLSRCSIDHLFLVFPEVWLKISELE
jgi:hypothetical protein